MIKLCTKCKYKYADINKQRCSMCNNNVVYSPSKLEVKEEYVLDFSGDDIKVSPLKNGELVINWEVPTRDNKEIK